MNWVVIPAVMLFLAAIVAGIMMCNVAIKGAALVEGLARPNLSRPAPSRGM